MTDPFEPIEALGDLAAILGDLAGASAYASWPDWAKARRAALMAMPHGERPPPMAASLYAIARADVNIGPEGWTALAQAADLSARWQLTNLAKSGVAAQLVAIARRERGEDGPHPVPEDDPALEPVWTAGWMVLWEPDPEEPED